MNRHLVDIAEALRNTGLFKAYRDHFRRLTGFTIFLTDPVAPGDPPAQSGNGFCRLLGRSGAEGDACRQFHHMLVRDVRRSPRTVRCPAGFGYTAIPVAVEDRPVALLELGPMAFRRPDPRRFDRLAGRPPPGRLSHHQRRLRDAWGAIGALSPARHRAIVGLLEAFSLQLGELAGQLVLHARSGEPNPVARAREFIEAHSCEEIHLPDVARAAHVSASYLSELFHTTTHDHFTHYVARLRVERSKRLLLGSGMRVIEIAYEVGFQSLSQFNRMFKRITGKTPTQFRAAADRAMGRGT